MADVAAELRKWERAQSSRDVWGRHWDDLARVMLPRRQGFVTEATPGERRTEDIFDGTPMQAARGLANALAGMMRPEGQQWFFLRAEEDEVDQSEEARVWLAEAEETLIEAFDNPRARFRQAAGEADLDLVVFGTAVMFIGEGQRLDHLLFQSIHLKDAAVLWDDEGNPVGMYRIRRPTVRQAILRFGEEALSRQTREVLRDNREEVLERPLRILHAVTLRGEGRIEALFSRNLPFADLWIEVDAKHELKEGGFHEFPFVVPRWDTSSGEDYGRSPGMIALPDANTLQAMGETMLVAGQRAADPPLMAPNDGSFSEVNTFPGGLSYYDVETAAQLRGRNPFFPLEPGSQMPLTREMQMDMRDQVFRAFFRNVLQLPVDGPEMTATEVIQRKEEFIREIGPVFGRLESDYTAPMVERAFNIMLRSGSFGPIPEVLQGRNVRFEYESPVKRIRQQVQASAAKLWAMEMLNMAQIKPEAADLVNVDELGRFAAEALGLPQGIVASREAVQALQQQRAQAQQAAQEMAMMEQGAGIADTAAGAAEKGLKVIQGGAA